MHDDDPALIDQDASATGILQCLRMLADEAADLRLAGTLRALREAIAICQSERIETPTHATARAVPARSQLH